MTQLPFESIEPIVRTGQKNVHVSTHCALAFAVYEILDLMNRGFADILRIEWFWPAH